MSNVTHVKSVNRRELSSLYILKALCAFGVIALHSPWGAFTPYIRLIASVTVPLFFMTTGYFLYSENKDKLQGALERSIKKIFVVILITHTIYTLGYLDRVPPLSDYMIWFKWIFMGHHRPAEHLWYLTALLETLLVLYVFTRLGWKKYIPLLAFCILFKLFFHDYKLLIWGIEPSGMSANALFYGIPFVSLGFIVHKYQSKLLQLPIRELTIISVVCFYLSNFFTLENDDFVLFQHIVLPLWRLVVTFSLFLFALSHSNYGKGTTLEYIGKKLSGNIYYWHLQIIYWIQASVSTNMFENWATPMVILLSTALAYLVVEFQRRVNINWLP